MNADSCNQPTEDNAFSVYCTGKRKPVELAPTYPLNVEDIHKLRKTVVLDSPKFLVWQLLAQLGSRFTLLSRFSESWAEIEPQLSEAVVEHVIAQSNAAQDYVVHSLIQALRDQEFVECADTLRHFLTTKRSIENALGTNARLASQRADVETIVDSIMQEVCNEIILLTDLQSSLKRATSSEASAERAKYIEAVERRIVESQDRIGRAYKAMQETQKQTSYQQPAQPEPQDQGLPESVVLDKLIDALREENDVAKAVNDRVRVELPIAE